MGGVFAKLWQSIFGIPEFKMVFVGLNNAGKTTIVYRITLGQVVATTPTIGSNVEEFTHKNVKFLVWDIGGQESLRDTWATYYANTKALVFVVDSTDRERFDLARDQLHLVLSDEQLKGAAVLVFANKQDVKGAMSAAEISQHFALHTIKDHEWHIEPCCALTGQGLEQGIEWLTERLRPQN